MYVRKRLMVELELDTRLRINEIASRLICLKLLIYLSSTYPWPGLLELEVTLGKYTVRLFCNPVQRCFTLEPFFKIC